MNATRSSSAVSISSMSRFIAVGLAEAASLRASW